MSRCIDCGGEIIEGEDHHCHNETHKVYFHTDSSENAYLDGEYLWEQALERKADLLKYYPSVSINGIRYWAEFQ